MTYKCCRCKRNHHISDFSYKRNGDLYKTCNKCKGINTSKDGSTQTTHYITIDEPDDTPIIEATNTILINIFRRFSIMN